MSRCTGSPPPPPPPKKKMFLMIESDLVVERNRKEVRIFPSRPRKKEMYEQDEHVLVVQKRGADDGESEKEKMGAKEEMVSTRPTF